MIVFLQKVSEVKLTRLQLEVLTNIEVCTCTGYIVGTHLPFGDLAVFDLG